MNTRIDWTTLNNQQRIEQQIGILPPHLTVRQPWCVHDAVFDQTNVLELLICRSRPRTHLYPHTQLHTSKRRKNLRFDKRLSNVWTTPVTKRVRE